MNAISELKPAHCAVQPLIPDMKRLGRTLPSGRLTLGMTGRGRAHLQGRCEPVNPYPFPSTTCLRRAQAWQDLPHAGPCLVRVAHHEAGHVVLMESIGLDQLRAEATANAGRAHWPEGVLESTPQPEPDPTGVLAARAAAVFHAGRMAEQLHQGRPWCGPLWYGDQVDFQVADKMLTPAFGRHASGAHAFAQRVALHVLARHWPRVQQIAAHLIAHGRWQSSDTPRPPPHLKEPDHG